MPPNSLDKSTYNRLVQAAMDLMWEKSYQAASVEDLCARANAKKGSFYHFFDSKTALAVTAIKESWNQVRENVFEPVFSSNQSGLFQLKAFTEKIYEFQTSAMSRGGSFLGCPFGNLGQEMAHQDEQLRQLLQSLFELHCAYFEGALRKAENEREIPPGDAKLRARNIFAFLEGSLLLAKVANNPNVFKEALPMVLSLATI